MKLKIFNNVKNAHATAEKKLRERLVGKVITEYNDVNAQLTSMKEKLSLYWDQMKSMEEKIKTWAQNVGKMEGRQGVIRLRLLELGVDANSLEKAGPALEGIHYTSATPVSTTSIATPSATVTQSDLGMPIQVEDTGSQIQADIHPIPAFTDPTVTSDIVTPPVASTALTAVPTPLIPPAAHVAQSGSTVTSTTSTPGMGQIIPLSAAQIAQLITPGGQSVGGAQQIVNLGGQNVLISGSGPGTVGSSSVRYGKILKGMHKFFCS